MVTDFMTFRSGWAEESFFQSGMLFGSFISNLSSSLLTLILIYGVRSIPDESFIRAFFSDTQNKIHNVVFFIDF